MEATAAVKERPIPMLAHEVRAILDGSKSQTRRVVTPQPEADADRLPCDYFHPMRMNAKGEVYPADEVFGCWTDNQDWKCPYGAPGDRLWVRESISKPFIFDIRARHFTGFYRATESDRKVPWVPSIHMPRWASRITLEITDVRVERVQQITYEDAVAEGIERVGGGRYWKGCDHPVKGSPKVFGLATQAFHSLWDSINAKRGFGWDVNPYVWAISFKRVEAK